MMLRDKKVDEDWSELDEEFHALMQKMLDESPEFQTHPPKKTDFSFLDKAPPDPNRIFDEPKSKESGVDSRKSSVVKRLSKTFQRVAVIVVCVLLTGTGIAIWINSEPAKASRFEIEKKFYEIREGIFSTEGGNANLGDGNLGNGDLEENQGNAIVLKYKSMEDLDKAKEFMPSLLIPQYVPDGYELEALTIEETSSGVKTAFYIFNQGENRMFIAIVEGQCDVEYELAAKSEVIEDDDRTLYVWKDEGTGSFGCSFIEDGKLSYVLADLEKEELIKIAQSM